MRSGLPKVLHPVAGKPMIAHVVATARSLNPDSIVVVHGHGGDLVKQSVSDHSITWVEQAKQLGTGHAVAQAIPHIDDDATILVLYGDVPLTQSDSLKALIEQTKGATVGLLTCAIDDPYGYGRIIRDRHGDISAIVEQKDATAEQLEINEINTGIMTLSADYFRTAYPRIDANNSQQEYYLTDIVGLAVADKLTVQACMIDNEDEILGVNDRMQLASVERIYQERMAWQLMLEGATLLDPSRIDVRGELSIGSDVVIDANVIFEGHVSLANGVHIGPNCVIKNTTIADNTIIESHCSIDTATIGASCNIGPFARIRPGTVLGDKAKIGNFVETKNAEIGLGSKINHLSYVGDSELGRDVNIGAGTITCNYDGANKHKTIIGDNAFIGSNTALVAPVTIGKGATIGAGSTISKNAPENELTLSRAKQTSISNWQRPKKES